MLTQRERATRERQVTVFAAQDEIIPRSQFGRRISYERLCVCEAQRLIAKGCRPRIEHNGGNRIALFVRV
jgi:hypothetical protein